MGNFVNGERTTSASPETVWKLLIDVENWPKTFTPHLKEAHLEGSVRLNGSGWVRTKLPPVRSTFTVNSVTPGRQWSWRGKLMWLTMNFNHRCQPINGGTRIVFDVDLTGPFAGLIRPVSRLTYRPQMERALDLLVEQAEKQTPTSGPSGKTTG